MCDDDVSILDQPPPIAHPSVRYNATQTKGNSIYQIVWNVRKLNAEGEAHAAAKMLPQEIARKRQTFSRAKLREA